MEDQTMQKAMVETRIRMAVAIASGAGLGSLIARGLFHSSLFHFFWWIGLLIGGLMGYVICEHHKVIPALKEAWAKATDWKPDWALWKGLAILYKNCLRAAIIIAIFAVLLYQLTGGHAVQTMFNLQVATLLTWISVYLLTSVIIFLLTICDDAGRNNITWAVKRNRESMKFLFPSKVFISYPVHIIKLALKALVFLLGLLLDLILALPKIATTLFYFSIYFLLIIYTKEAVICAFFAFLGAAIGFFAHNTILGMAMGVMFGLTTYEIYKRRIEFNFACW